MPRRTCRSITVASSCAAQSCLGLSPASVRTGRVSLMRSIRHLFVYSFDRRMGWDDVALGGVDVDAVPGDHEGILAGPNAVILGRPSAAWPAAQSGVRR